MALEVASLYASLGLDNKKFNDGLKESGGKLNSFAKDFASGFGAGLGISAFDLGAKAIAGLGQALVSSIQSAREAVAIDKQLEQVIRSTGGAAGVSADQARDLADSLSLVTNFEDDAIVGAENLLLTFTKIGSDVFPRATETVLDMSQALGQDLKSSSIQLGKALNDPIKGMTALQRVGVTFSASQKEQIKNFQKAGELAKAQGVILDELATEFGGSARALADPFIQLQNVIGNIGEKLGMGVLPVLNSLAQATLPALSTAMDSLSVSMGTLGAKDSAMLTAGLTSIFNTAGEVLGAFDALGTSLGKLGQALGITNEETTGLGVLLNATVAVVQAFLGPIKAVAMILDFLAGVVESVAFVISKMGMAINTATTAHQGLINAGRETAGVWGGLASAGQTLYQWILNIVEGWRLLISTLSQNITIPAWLTPGSPTPLELGLKGISQQIKSMPDMAGAFGGSIPTAAGAGGSTSNITVNIGGVSATSTTNGDPASEAIRLTLQLLRQQLQPS